MRRAAAIVVVVLLFAGAYWIRRSRRPPPEQAYAGERRVVVWSSTAQVREPLATLGYGERVTVLERATEMVNVRTVQGLVGWVDGRQLMTPALWHRATDLLAQAHAMPIEARGHTRAVSNLRVEPGRSTERLIQLGRDVPVEVLARRTADAPASPDEDKQDSDSPRQEDWLLVRAQVKDLGEAGGWVLGRFIEFDLPQPLPDYATSAGMHIVAWFELNHVKDPKEGNKPQYLVAGTRGPEGQPCDFTQLRVYTWGAARRRYETAFVESHLCGKLPIGVTSDTTPGGDATFHFANSGRKGDEERSYRMHQTVVRRVRAGQPSKTRKRGR